MQVCVLFVFNALILMERDFVTSV